MMTDDPVQDSALREQARRLGVAESQRLDVEGIVTGVLDRLKHERLPKRGRIPVWWRSGWIRIAATIMLVAGGGLVARLVLWERQQQALVVDELQDLSTAQLREVLGSLDQTLETPVPESGSEGVDDMTTEQLEAVLQTLEG
jgi:hypothetical protein